MNVVILQGRLTDTVSNTMDPAIALKNSALKGDQ